MNLLQRIDCLHGVVALCDAIRWLGSYNMGFSVYQNLLRNNFDGTQVNVYKFLNNYKASYNFDTTYVDIKSSCELIGFLKRHEYAVLIGHYENNIWYWGFWYGYGRNHFWGSNFQQHKDIIPITLEAMDWILSYSHKEVILLRKLPNTYSNIY